jgi:plasmid stability protein
MSAITIKDMPARLHRELKARAEIHGRSLNTEVLACLETSVRSSAVDIDRLLENARALRRSTPVRLTEKDLVALKGAGRA